jgi:1,5-anhydro-D-fructose reductase (1,5-anhydro-D-mannitol-forming)
MLTWALVGVGDISKKRVLAGLGAEPRSRLKAVVTTHPDRARELCAPYKVQHFHSKLDEALADPEINAVYIATPVFLHAPQAMAAMRAGKHVLCEKPTALSFQEAAQMADTADECGVRYGVAFYRRMYPKVRRAMQLIREGAIGAVTLVEARYHWWWAPEEDHERRWFVEPHKSGGGPLPDVGSHRIDVLNYMFGPPASVLAELGNQVHHYGVEDAATLLLAYASGMRAVVDVRWNSRLERDEFRIVGTEGELEMTPLNKEPMVIRTAKGDKKEKHAPHDNLHYPMIENFVSAVLDGAELVSSGRTAMETDRVISAAFESARVGCRVPLSRNWRAHQV